MNMVGVIRANSVPECCLEFWVYFGSGHILRRKPETSNGSPSEIVIRTNEVNLQFKDHELYRNLVTSLDP
jgi:hypothetical protein